MQTVAILKRMPLSNGKVTNYLYIIDHKFWIVQIVFIPGWFLVEVVDENSITQIVPPLLCCFNMKTKCKTTTS